MCVCVIQFDFIWIPLAIFLLVIPFGAMSGARGELREVKRDAAMCRNEAERDASREWEYE